MGKDENGDTAERPDAIVGDVHVLRLEHQNPTSYLVSGSGDRGTPVIHISGYFDSYIDG